MFLFTKENVWHMKGLKQWGMRDTKGYKYIYPIVIELAYLTLYQTISTKLFKLFDDPLWTQARSHGFKYVGCGLQIDPTTTCKANWKTAIYNMTTQKMIPFLLSVVGVERFNGIETWAWRGITLDMLKGGEPFYSIFRSDQRQRKITTQQERTLHETTT